MKNLFLLVFALLPAIAFAQLNEGDMSRYLAADAVPVVDGHVVFADNLELIPGYSQQDVYKVAKGWIETFLKGYDAQTNRIISEKEDEIVAMGSMEIIFTNNALSYDKATMNYVMTLSYTPQQAGLRIERIRYVYNDGGDVKKLTAEEYITDENAVNKKRTKLTPITGKFRKRTLDAVDEIFGSFNEAFRYYSKNGMAEFVKNAPKVMDAKPAPAAAAPAQAQVAAQPVQKPVEATPAPQAAPVAQVPAATAASNPLEGYRQVDPESIPGNFIKMVSKDWMLITAGNSSKFNMMTASWGGIGVLYNKPVAICFINPARYTYQIIENSDTYTLTFYTEAYRDALKYCGSKSGRDEDKVKGSGLTPLQTPEGSMAFSEAWMIIECRKLVSQSISLDAIDNAAEKAKRASQPMHKMYIGEILNVWVK